MVCSKIIFRTEENEERPSTLEQWVTPGLAPSTFLVVVLFCRKKGKRKREAAEAAARAQEAVIEDEVRFGSATGGTSAGGSGSESEGKKDTAGDGDEQAGKDTDDMLTPAQRRFREKQLEREVRFVCDTCSHQHYSSCCWIAPSRKWNHCRYIL